MQKVFCIGLSKTGTTSVRVALTGLDYEVAAPERMPEGSFDAATHEYVAANFKELDHKYPGSKFIYTVRAKEDWLRSMRRHWRWHQLKRHPIDPLSQKLWEITDWTFDREKIALAYDAHERRVLEYFKERPDDLLIIDIGAGEGWQKLCNFLGQSVPALPFPRKNVGVGSAHFFVRHHLRELLKSCFFFFRAQDRSN